MHNVFIVQVINCYEKRSGRLKSYHTSDDKNTFTKKKALDKLNLKLISFGMLLHSNVQLSFIMRL